MIDKDNPARPDGSASNQWPYPSNKDWLLARLVNLAAFGIEQGVTLQVAGSIISGTLISAEVYLEEMAKITEEAEFTGSGADQGRAFMTDFYRGWKIVYKLPDDMINNEPPPPNYIHLKNARWVTPGGSMPTNTGVLWRGRLSCVEGFSVGSIGSSSS